MTIADTAPTYRCAGPSCPGLPYRASDLAHPASCAAPAEKSAPDQISTKLARIDGLRADLEFVVAQLGAALASSGMKIDVDGLHAATRSLGLSAKHIRHQLAEIRRPKGPIVELRWTGRVRDNMHAEVIRRTATRVLLGATIDSDGTWYDLKTGRAVGRHDRYFGEWRITALAQLHAMPPGENAVSRALKAART